MKFVLYIDYKAKQLGRGFEYLCMNAKTLEEAIEEADELWDETIYLARIMEKVGKIEQGEGCRFETYVAFLCRRTYGWYRNTKENSEVQHVVTKNWLTNNKNVVWFERC